MEPRFIPHSCKYLPVYLGICICAFPQTNYENVLDDLINFYVSEEICILPPNH